MFSRLASSSSRALSRSLSRPFPHPSYASSSTLRAVTSVRVRHNTTDAAAPAAPATTNDTAPVADAQSSVEKARKEKFLPEFSMAGKVRFSPST